jgi:hypothetical protein
LNERGELAFVQSRVGVVIVQFFLTHSLYAQPLDIEVRLT